ncbi:hypothetical protein FB45DRAFT_1011280 [Roridomyces roridus]|uniref:Uncharacterized protein n=1 Tax=Roridomyces roridus TaxID=1738132 RepID=A0AAD7B1T9_9AGAR|nr:hypothetical protein FB45DRAFT_1011280 [Roridomyces roridus]
MCNTVSSLKSSAILVTLSLLPGAIASYTTLGLAVAAAVIYLGYRQLPSERLGRLASIIEATETQLKNAKSISARAIASLTEIEERLLQAKREASETKVHLLKVDEKESWMDYLRTIREIIQSIADCGLDVKDIQTDIWIVMEEETQRKISEGVGEARSVLATIHSALPHAPRKIRRRRGAQSTDQSMSEEKYAEGPSDPVKCSQAYITGRCACQNSAKRPGRQSVQHQNGKRHLTAWGWWYGKGVSTITATGSDLRKVSKFTEIIFPLKKNVQVVAQNFSWVTIEWRQFLSFQCTQKTETGHKGKDNVENVARLAASYQSGAGSVGNCGKEGGAWAGTRGELTEWTMRAVAKRSGGRTEGLGLAEVASRLERKGGWSTS